MRTTRNAELVNFCVFLHLRSTPALGADVSDEVANIEMAEQIGFDVFEC